MAAVYGYHDFLPSRRFWPGLRLSPDARHVAYLDDGSGQFSGQFNVTVQPVTGGPPRPLTRFTDRRLWDLAWHPDGQWLVTEADLAGDENRQIFRVPLAGGGEPVALTERPDVQYNLGFGPPFSPDGARLAYAGNDLVPSDQDLLVREVGAGTVDRVMAGTGMLMPGYWAADSTRLSVIQFRDSSSDHLMYAVPVGGGKPRLLTPVEGQATYWPGPWLPDGSGFLVRSNLDREFTGLAVMDASTGELAWQETPDWDVEDVALSADGRVLVWLVNVAGASQLSARDLRTGERIDTPALPLGHAWSLDVSAGGALVAMQLSTPTSPANVVVADLARGELRWLTEVAPAGADSAGLVEPELVHYPAGGGRQVPAYLYRPRPAAGDRTGVVLFVHGGPTTQERPAYQALYQYLLHHGVAVLAPNIGGSTGYGRSYMMRVYRDWGGRDLDDLADAARWLQAQDWVDPDRIGLWGRSYGGFAVLSCVARRPELRWAAAVDVCGMSDLVTLARSSPPTWRSRVAAIIGDPDTDEQFLRARSPVTYADQIRAPLFILQGANDPRVPRQESDQIVARLRRRGVAVRYDVYPDEGHGFAKRENQLRADSDAGEFLLSHLAS